jgi:hypothetical protein
MSMKRVFLFGFFFAFLPFASQAAERNGPPAKKNHDVRKATAPLLSGKPIEPAEASEEPPRAGWNGAYFGVSAGAAMRDADR